MPMTDDQYWSLLGFQWFLEVIKFYIEFDSWRDWRKDMKARGY